MVNSEIGEYRILEKIGQGGMGEVYKAEHVKLGQIVAIKMLSSEYSESEKMNKRFLNEARIQARFAHPNVVNILNFFEYGNKTYLVMEFVKGETLESILKRKGKLGVNEVLRISYSVLRALVFMHSKGVIHRDIKPSNIMLTEDGRVKVTDFGIAKSLTESTMNTKTGIVGSVDYVSPEQILGEQTTTATDIYSLGITLYRMLTGSAPFKGETEFIIMKKHLEDAPIAPRNINKDIPRWVSNIIVKSISKAKEDRFISADEMIKALKEGELDGGLYNNISNALQYIIIKFYALGSRKVITTALVALVFLTVLSFGINKLLSNNNPDRSDNLIKNNINDNDALVDTALIDTGYIYPVIDNTEDDSDYVFFEPEYQPDSLITDKPENEIGLQDSNNYENKSSKENYSTVKNQHLKTVKKKHKKPYIPDTQQKIGKYNKKPESKWKIRK